MCGNGRVEPGEACDDGNARNDDGCLRTCQPARCGDGYLWRGVEECDEGAGNSNQPGAACRTDCTLPDICGDADRDGRVTTADAARIISAAVGIDGECRFSVCDVNGDGQISVLDAATVLAVLSGSDVAFFDCSLPIRFWIAPSAALDEVAFEVDYGASGSTFVGAGEAAACVATVPVLSAQFENLANARVLRVRLGFAKALERPQVVAICGFVNDRTPSTALRPDDFSVRVISSSLGYSRMPGAASSAAAAGPEPEIRVLF
ncbi:MAG: hypothetical protein D6815_03370 [Candidatus Dadabacteria bacterium]|nr:MAG: hypothetical protein D6815_03370 [Candidatus Dadabacteria bacterium]